jgi:nicotinamide mononucleotide transporter
MSPTLALILEWTAVVLNIAFTILIGRELRSGWVFGFIAALIGIVLYAVQDACLMSALNGFYAAMGLYGWWSWGHDDDARRITRFPWQRHVLLLAIGLSGAGLLVLVMKQLGQPGEYLGMEAFITSFAMVATWMMGRKALENWYYWTIGDAVAVVYNHLIGYDGYALLNAVYIGLAVVGFIRWRRQWQARLVAPT